MVALWDGYDFDHRDLEFWAQEVSGAAMDLPAAERNDFLEGACAGSDRLRRKVVSLLEHSMAEPLEPLDQMHRPGEEVRNCLILCRIGQGASSEVYKAIQKSVRRLVAVKVIRSIAPEERVAFAREATSTSSLRHEHIITVHDADFTRTQPCVVMEYVDGITLREWLRREHAAGERRPSEPAVRSIFGQVLAALREAHSHGLIHRDIKPENILLSMRGSEYRVKVVDFGLAHRAGSPGDGVAGTPGYIAPEQLSGAAADARTDIFSLGVVLYEAVTGTHPFLGASAGETCYNTLQCQPAKLTGGELGAYAGIIGRALEKTPERRYQSIDEMAADLLACPSSQKDSPGNPFLSEFPRGVRQWLERNRSGFAVAAGSCAWGLLSLVLSILCGAACLRVVWKPDGGSNSFEMIYGYAVELNAGLWYVAGTSLCFLGGFALLEAAYAGLSNTKTLTGAGPPHEEGPLTRIAASNREYFAFILPIVIVLAVCIVLIPEVGFRESHAFGWVQADLAQNYTNATYDELRRAGKIGDLPAVRHLCSNCTVRVVGVYNRSEGYRRPQRLLFSAFLFSALTHQIALSAFFAYISLKVLFFFGLLSRALLGSERRGVRLNPDLEDRDDYRFGLGRWDNVYYAILILLGLASLAGFLQAASNLNKGTYFFQGKAAFALIGQPLTLLTVFVLLAAVVLIPVVVFLLVTIRVVNQELARLSSFRKTLEAQLRCAPTGEDRERVRYELEALQGRRETIGKQSLLPSRSPLFRGLLALNVVLLLVMPATLGTEFGTKVWHHISTTVSALCGNSPRMD